MLKYYYNPVVKNGNTFYREISADNFYLSDIKKPLRRFDVKYHTIDERPDRYNEKYFSVVQIKYVDVYAYYGFKRKLVKTFVADNYEVAIVNANMFIEFKKNQGFFKNLVDLFKFCF